MLLRPSPQSEELLPRCAYSLCRMLQIIVCVFQTIIFFFFRDKNYFSNRVLNQRERIHYVEYISRYQGDVVYGMEVYALCWACSFRFDSEYCRYHGNDLFWIRSWLKALKREDYTSFLFSLRIIFTLYIEGRSKEAKPVKSGWLFQKH